VLEGVRLLLKEEGEVLYKPYEKENKIIKVCKINFIL
jgi:hypothetical protein